MVERERGRERKREREAEMERETEIEMDRAGAVGNKCLIITLIIIPGGSELAREIVEGE